MPAFYAPDPINSTQFQPGSNTPASGALLFCYQNRTSTKMNSYSDPTASTANTNPIVLNSGGNPPQQIWIASTATFVLAPSNDTDPPSSPYRTWNDIPGVNNVSALVASSAAGEWVQGSTATFVGVTAFSVAGDQTALYTLGRRIKATVTGGDRFGIVTSSVFGANTAVGVTLDSSTLNAGLSAVWYGLLSTPNGSVPWLQITSTGIFIEGTVSTGAVSTGALSVGGRLTANNGIVGAGLDYLSSTVVNNTTYVLFNSSLITSLYDEYEFHIRVLLPVTNGAVAYVRLSSSNGISWASTAGYLYLGGGSAANSSYAQYNAATSEILVSVSSGVSNDQFFGGLSGVLRLHQPFSTNSIFKRISFVNEGAGAANFFTNTGMGYLGAPYSGQSINSLQFLFSTGNVSTGIIRLYGLKS